jgi:hypothetical protein
MSGIEDPQKGRAEGWEPASPQDETTTESSQRVKPHKMRQRLAAGVTAGLMLFGLASDGKGRNDAPQFDNRPGISAPANPNDSPENLQRPEAPPLTNSMDESREQLDITPYASNEIIPSPGEKLIPPLSLSTESLGLETPPAPDNQEGIQIMDIVRNPASGRLTIQDTSPQGLPQTTIDWVRQATGDIEPLLNSVLATESADDIQISVVDQVNWSPYFDGRSVHLQLLPSGIFDTRLFEKVAAHESGHAAFGELLISDVTEGELASEFDQKVFAEACSSIRKAAAKTVEENFYKIEPSLDKYLDLNPELKPAVDILKQFVSGGALESLYPLSNDNNIATEVATCNFSDIVQPIITIQEALALDQDIVETKEQGNVLIEFDSIFIDIVKNLSAYGAFSESSYPGIDSQVGHPFDSLDELAASMIDLTMTDPEFLGQKVGALPPEEKNAVLTMHSLIMDRVTNREGMEKLRAYLEPRILAFQQAAATSSQDELGEADLLSPDIQTQPSSTSGESPHSSPSVTQSINDTEASAVVPDTSVAVQQRRRRRFHRSPATRPSNYPSTGRHRGR